MNDDSTISGSGQQGAPRAVLVIEDDRSRVVALPESGELVVGRAAEASIVVDGPRLSRRHARLVVANRRVYVEDLGSHNGTRVGGVGIAPHVPMPLQTGDVVECGGALLLLRSAAAGATPGTAPSLVVSDDARWFRRDGGDAVQLGRRGALRLLLASLVERRLAAPGFALDVDAMFAAGWPGERIARESAQARVYTSVQRLRGLGLDGVLVTRGDGYLLDPAIDVRRG